MAYLGQNLSLIHFISRSWARLVIILSVVCSIAACALPVLEPATTYRFELEGFADGRPFSFQQYSTCYPIAVLSARDGQYHKQWNCSDSGAQVGQVGDNLFVIYSVGCDPKVSKKSIIAAIDSVENPKTLQLFRVLPTEPLITITKCRLEPIDASNVTLGPPPVQVQLKETLRANQRGFQRVRARIIPYEIFATSDQAKTYFDSLKGVVIAAQQDGIPSRLVFPFFSQRDFAKLRASSEYKKELVLSFDGEEFAFGNVSAQPSDVYYSTPNTRGSKSPWEEPKARVRYKNASFEVQQAQEIYDAERKAIIVFYNEHQKYPWPSPEDADIRRFEARKRW